MPKILRPQLEQKPKTTAVIIEAGLKIKNEQGN